MSKGYTLRCAAYNLGVLLRKVWGLCKPRNAKAGAAALFWAFLPLLVVGISIVCRDGKLLPGWWLGGYGLLLVAAIMIICLPFHFGSRKNRPLSTGC